MIGNKILLDTNILIYHLQEREEGIFSLIELNDICVSVISKIELLGYHAITSSEERRIHEFLQTTQLVSLDDAIINVAIGLRKQYKLKTPDSIIAATAMHMAIPLVTADNLLTRLEDLTIIKYES